LAEIPSAVLRGGVIAIGGAQTVALFREGSAQPATNHTAIPEFLLEDVDVGFDRLKDLGRVDIVCQPKLCGSEI